MLIPSGSNVSASINCLIFLIIVHIFNQESNWAGNGPLLSFILVPLWFKSIEGEARSSDTPRPRPWETMTMSLCPQLQPPISLATYMEGLALFLRSYQESSWLIQLQLWLIAVHLWIQLFWEWSQTSPTLPPLPGGSWNPESKHHETTTALSAFWPHLSLPLT